MGNYKKKLYKRITKNFSGQSWLLRWINPINIIKNKSWNVLIEIVEMYYIMSCNTLLLLEKKYLIRINIDYKNSIYILLVSNI